MKKYRVVLVDDEPDCTEVLAWMLQEYCPQAEVAAVFHKPEEALAALPALDPDVLFLDIEMPRMNGFQLLENLLPVKYKVVFTTAYDQFAVKAFRYSAVDYLLKPLDKEDLKVAFSRIASRDLPLQGSLEELLLQVRKNNEPRRLAIPTQEGLLFIKLDDIISCESDSNYTTFHLESREKIIASRTMKEFEDLLEEHFFCRIHNSHIINLRKISSMCGGTGGTW